ncbi:argininosuccinate synthase domain-containing protein [Sulfurospirillum multivorans]|uniref:tRNA (5-methylaminomethyl-2-thiouridylate)-methyltransferase n=2 Tax=Sulfurospirillum multivorans TaxID=66821 RepID=A0AA86E0N9_SULMK|nr:argininosuccinate synthase domain-containing protein [Sulfurospirillum multivorans]AHJ13965.1 putative tRNA (5-methylaminomethyl-2-thiouridylate)-methyltransferase [Sulfurospirillum multivorans DSM 12446]QEH07453.1 putative tRNA (5-methylaminomethyl-2-thiouridylate)-methyltransferase [Sulfurospirillum multivorans]
MKALVLYSGGLDSMLAMKLLSDQGIEVIALHINIGFGIKEDHYETLKRRSAIAGATLEVIDVRDQYLQEILFSPKHGYGKQFNPCIDCHGFMFTVAKSLLPRYGASFIATGEVVGQRPMSQNKDALRLVKKIANDIDEDIILRPLCALVMEETKPEREGWVDRSRLLGFNGRGRHAQLALAKELGWEDFPTPAGGCLLTDVQFTARLRDFIAHDTFAKEDIDVLKNGRHFRLPAGAKLVIGRNETENDFLDSLHNPKFNLLHVSGEMNAPSSLLSKNASASDEALACRMVLSFTKAIPEQTYALSLGEKILYASPYASKEESKKYLI